MTSSNPTDTEGGTGNPVVDSGKVAVKCEGNKQTGGDLFSASCQAKLNALCCTELKTCFDIAPTADAGADGGTTPDDCNKFSSCITDCKTKADGTPETDQAALSACGDDCEALSTPEVAKAYDAIVACATAKANADCQ